ncbi:MAG: T9SS type A sorting domain-containing protein [Bacteroidia bacterium]
MKTIAKTLSLILIAIMTFAAAPALKAADHSDEAKAIKMRLVGTDHVNAGSALTAELTSTLATDAKLMVTNADGKVFAEAQLTVDQGENRVKLNVSDIPSGVYFIKLVAAGKRETLTFVVQ